MTQRFFQPSHLLLFWDPGSGIRDGQKSASGIRDKHTPGEEGGWGLIFCKTQDTDLYSTLSNPL